MTTPAWCRWLLTVFVPTDRLDDVLGDLEEIHRRRLAVAQSTIGHIGAWCATSAEAVRWAVAFSTCRWISLSESWSWISWAEVRLAFRLIRKQPMMAATSIFALALGIAVATMGFTVIDAIFHGKLPLENEERFTRLEVRSVPHGRAQSLDLERLELFRNATSFDFFGAFDRQDLNLFHASGEVESVVGARISPEVFRFLPYVPLAGRYLGPADGQAGATPVAVLRESLWKRRYGGTHDAIGQTITIDGDAHTIVGVLADQAGFPSGGEVWLPFTPQSLEASRFLTCFGILRENTSLTAANDELTAISLQALNAATVAVPPEVMLSEAVQTEVVQTKATQTETVRLEPFLESRPEEKLTGSLTFVVLVLLLLVIAANVASLVLTRSSARTGELAVRTALGADRGRLIGQLAAEAAVLSAIAAGIGLLTARLTLDWLEPRIAEKPFWLTLDINARTLAFVLFVTLLATVVCGVWPALEATRGRMATALQAHGRQRGNFALGRVGSSLMVVEMGLSVAMLSAALVIASGLASVNSVPDLPQDQILTARVFDERADAELDGSQDARDQLPGKIRQALSAIPGVVQAGAGRPLPLQAASERQVVVAAEAGAPATEPQTALVARVRPGFLESLKPTRVAGRLIAEHDLASQAHPVVVVNEPFVDKFLGGANAIGRRIQIFDPDDSNASGLRTTEIREIVGVVPDLGLSAADPTRAAGFYLPWSGNPRSFDLVMRIDGDPAAWAGAVRRAVASVDAGLRLTRVLPLNQASYEQLSMVTAFSTSLVVMGIAVMTLSLVGIYALISFSVRRRTREIGIRVALGASRRQVLRSIVGSASLYLGTGGLLGILLAAAFSQVKDQLWGIRLPADEPLVVPAVLLLLLIAGIVACWVPARRALGIMPADALRSD